MTTGHDILDELVALSRHLGDPAHDYAILAEGNTSAVADGSTFWVKASGTSLRDAERGSFVRVDAARVLDAVDAGTADDEEIRRILADVTVRDRGAGGAGAGTPRRPSVETFLHAVCLRLDAVRFVGHTHPTAVNAITCSTAFEDALRGRLFPDEIVLLGPAPVVVPYVDPGLPLALEIRRRLEAYVAERGEAPAVIYLQNHGFMALGSTARQVIDRTAMAVKAARILIGTSGLGGPHFLAAEAVRRINRRPDEHYRQGMLAERPPADGGGSSGDRA